MGENETGFKTEEIGRKIAPQRLIAEGLFFEYLSNPDQPIDRHIIQLTRHG